MFDKLRRTFGFVQVKEGPRDITITGIPADVMAKDIHHLWLSPRVNSHMFTSITHNSMSFPKFFAVEVHYMLGQIKAYDYSKTGGRTIKAILVALQENTWLKNITNPEIKSKVDMSRLNNLKITPFPHQIRFMEAYGENTARYGLNGYLAAAGPGTGKTIMTLSLAECLNAKRVIIVVPKNVIDRVWVSTIQGIFKKPQTLWVAGRNLPYKGERFVLTHFAALNKTVDALQHGGAVSDTTVILDESHNLNEPKSTQTQLFLKLCRDVAKANNVIWASGTPIKAMGYEIIPLLRSIDPLFTPDVEKRFMYIFGRESRDAVDIMRHRIGKVSYKIESGEVVNNGSTEETINVRLPDGDKYTIESVRAQMKKSVLERTKHYKDDFKKYRRWYQNGVEAYERVMPSDQKSDFKRYQKAIKMIAAGYDPVAHKEEAAFANNFERKVIIPAIPDKETRDQFKNARSVIKYVNLKIMGEALASVLGKARMNVHMEMAEHIDWSAIADQSRKKVVVFTSYVEVAKKIQDELTKHGFKSVGVFGDTSSDVAAVLGDFEKSEDTKFLVATYQSLSTGVPLTMASTTVFTNSTWRAHEMEQAKARTDRIGQDGPVLFIHTFLDTGEEPNISTRSRDIMEWSKDMVERMTAGDELGGMAAELNSMGAKYAMEALTKYDDSIDTMFEAWRLECRREEEMRV